MQRANQRKIQMKRITKIIIPLVILLAGFGIMKLLLSLREAPDRKSHEIKPKIVSVEEIRLESINTEIIAYGRVQSVQPIELYSEVSGVLMAGDYPFRPAQRFKKGDLILKVDDRQAILELNSKKSELLTALAVFTSEIKSNFPDEYKLWQDYFDGCGFDRKLSQLPETSDSRIKLFLSRFNVYKLYFSARDLEIKLEKHFFYAPFDGSIISTNLRAGSTVRPGTLIGEIIDIGRLEIEARVAAEDIQWIDKRKPVEITSTEFSGKWPGTIKRIGSAIDDRTQTVQVFISIDSNTELPAIDGLFLEANIQGKAIDRAVKIPKKAVYNTEFVYLIDNGKFEYKKIFIARNGINSVIVNGGLHDGDTLVVDVLQGVAQGDAAKARAVSFGEESE